MLYLILGSLMLFQIDQVNYYYFTTTSCVYCRKQLPIIEKLQEEGFDFEILDDPKDFEITAYPTIVIELIDYKRKEIKRIKLVGFHSYSKLKATFEKIEESKTNQADWLVFLRRTKNRFRGNGKS